ncbi:MAG: CheR family methyltransferase [Ramlibacter sp.]
MLDVARGDIWEAASRWIEDEIGLHFQAGQRRDLQRRLDAAAARLGLPDARSCAQWLLQGQAGARGREVLAECLGIRETYFFRDPPFFGQLTDEVLAPLIETRRNTTRHLRLWSAGCATGEEPYSLAMLVASLLPDWRQWNIAILATDLNAAALDRGRAGTYGPWSVRGSVPELAAPYLLPRAGGRHEVHEDIRRTVHFEQLNLVTTGAFPASAADIDLIVCRNVLMYFAPARRGAVLCRLRDALADGGWVVTNPVEIPAAGVDGMTVAIFGGLVALRRSAGAADVPSGRAAAAPAALARRAPAAAPIRRSRPGQVPPAAAPAGDRPEPAAAAADREAACRRAMRDDKLDPQWPYLLSCILSERGADDEAAAALQRTLYLAPDHVLAHFNLGSIAARQGRPGASRRHFAAALGRLSSGPPDEVVPGSGGMTARELARVIGTSTGGA